MVFGSYIPSSRGSLTPQQALDLANIYLEGACSANDPEIAIALCHDTEVSLSQAKRAIKRTDNQTVLGGIATAYIDLGKLLENRGFENEAQISFKKAEKLGQVVVKVDELAALKLPEPDERLINTPQLACCLGLLQASHSPESILDPTARRWLQTVVNDADEKERLYSLATEVIRAFKRDEIKDAKAIAEVVCLAPVLNRDSFHDLLREFYTGIEHCSLLNFHLLEGLAQLIQGASPGYLEADDLVRILRLLSTRLMETHQQSVRHMYQLTLAVSRVLDAMADLNVSNLDRERIHEPLSFYLNELKGSSDPYLVYQAAYAYQALLCIPDNESAWQTAMRRTGKVIQGLSGVVSGVKGLDLIRFFEGVDHLHKGLSGLFKLAVAVKKAYEGANSLAGGGQTLLSCLMDGFSFECKRDWYTVLRGADTLIQDGEFTTLRKLVCDAPCRHDPAFQWGVCQRLGEVASNPTWDTGTRQSAIGFLGSIYSNDEAWGQQPTVKQW
ncbi:hypothetical protein BGX31_000857, partial [Mortierella sp. GBA43]